MKKKISILLSLLLLCALCLSCGQEPQDENATAIVPDGYTKIVCGDKSGENTFGTSVEFDPHFFSQNRKKGIGKDEDWEIVERRVAQMGVNRFRVMILPSWLEPFNDDDSPDTVNWNALTPNSEEMKSLYKVLDLAQKNNIDVNLTLWGAETNVSLIDAETNAAVKAQGGHFLAKGNQVTHWVAGTLYPQEFAENFSIYLQLLRKKGYTCIKEITPCNEPDYGYMLNSHSASFEGYKQLCLAIHERFVKDGIRDTVLFNLSDNIDTNRHWLIRTAEELDEIADVYSSHTYIFGYDTPNATITEWETENLNATRNTGKPHVIGEFGSNQAYGSSRQRDIDLYERGVLLVREMCNFYNVGAACASYWVLFDEYYNYTDTYDNMMMLGLWKSTKDAYISDRDYYATVKEDYEVRPQYYAFSLFSRYVPKGAEVYPVSLHNDFAVGTAFKGKDDKWVYVFANGNKEGENLRLSLHNTAAYGDFEKYEYVQASLPQRDNLIASSGTAHVTGQMLSFELAPQTVVLFRQK